MYTAGCVSLLRNVHSQPDHDDITLLSPATFAFDFFFFFIGSHSLLMVGGRGPNGWRATKRKDIHLAGKSPRGKSQTWRLRKSIDRDIFLTFGPSPWQHDRLKKCPRFPKDLFHCAKQMENKTGFPFYTPVWKKSVFMFSSAAGTFHVS